MRRIRALGLDLSLSALGLGLGRLDLRRKLLLILAQLADFVAQAQQVFVVLAQPDQLVALGLRAGALWRRPLRQSHRYV